MAPADGIISEGLVKNIYQFKVESIMFHLTYVLFNVLPNTGANFLMLLSSTTSYTNKIQISGI